MPTATTSDGATIAYDDDHGAGTPLLLLAGQANAHTWWDPVRADLAARHRTVAPDMRGTGGSPAGADTAYSVRRFAADAVAVLDAAGIDRAHVYGTSMGGRVAQWLAVDHPHRVAALVLGATTPGGPGSVPAAPDVVGPIAGSGPEARRALAELMAEPAWLDAHPGTVDAVCGDTAMTAAARRGHRRASAAHDASAALARITAPTLVLHGADDLFCPVANAEALASGIAGAELIVFAGARHAYFLDHRDAASAAALDFLARHDR